MEKSFIYEIILDQYFREFSDYLPKTATAQIKIVNFMVRKLQSLKKFGTSSWRFGGSLESCQVRLLANEKAKKTAHKQSCKGNILSWGERFQVIAYLTSGRVSGEEENENNSWEDF